MWEEYNESSWKKAIVDPFCERCSLIDLVPTQFGADNTLFISRFGKGVARELPTALGSSAQGSVRTDNACSVFTRVHKAFVKISG